MDELDENTKKHKPRGRHSIDINIDDIGSLNLI